MWLSLVSSTMQDPAFCWCHHMKKPIEMTNRYLSCWRRQDCILSSLSKWWAITKYRTTRMYQLVHAYTTDCWYKYPALPRDRQWSSAHCQFSGRASPPYVSYWWGIHGRLSRIWGALGQKRSKALHEANIFSVWKRRMTQYNHSTTCRMRFEYLLRKTMLLG